jgi:hypothetical protein
VSPSSPSIAASSLRAGVGSLIAKRNNILILYRVPCGSSNPSSLSLLLQSVRYPEVTSSGRKLDLLLSDPEHVLRPQTDWVWIDGDLTVAGKGKDRKEIGQ